MSDRPSAGQARLKFLDDVSDAFPYSDEVGVPISPLAKRYSDGDVGLRAHIWFWDKGFEADSQKLCARFHRSRKVTHVSSSAVRTAVSPGDLDIGRDVVEVSPGRVQKPMFVHVGEPAKDGERMLWRKCPSMVWLEPLDRCDVVVGQLVELNSALLNPSASARLSVTDRELRMSAFAVREPEFEQRTGQVVKSGAEVVSKFAYNDTQSERRFRNVAVFEAVATGITV